MEAQTLAKGKDQAAVALSVMTREKECRPATSSFAWENAERAMDSGIGRSRPTEACPGATPRSSCAWRQVLRGAS